MCGIAGIFGEPDPLHARDAVLSMNAAHTRRGPDGEGFYAWKTAALGHRRLAIFDLSDAGAQPMLSPDKQVGVVFNGAIYNFHELRDELEKRGYRFKSRTDTEVLVHGYHAWGVEKLVAKLHGMFAIAIWDDGKQTAYLIRDRLGVKPVFYAIRNGRLAFASTIFALEAAGFASEFDECAVAEFLEYGFISDERSVYCGISKLPAAHFLEFRNGRATASEYWRTSQPSTGPRPRFEDAVEHAERLFLNAVRMRLEADVPVGALLSSGIDSSLVCWGISKLGGDITAYTVGTPGDQWDETADARATASELGIRHRVLTTDPNISPRVSDLSSAYGEPFACASALGMLTLSRAVKEEATVLLTGDGGDDVFLGYPRHRHYFEAQRLAQAIPDAAAPIWKSLRPLVPKRSVARRAAHFLDYATGGLGAVVSAHDGLPTYKSFGLLGERFANASVAWRELPWNISSGRRVLDDFIEYERRTRFVGEYMTKVDGATMYYGLEARSPFLDQELWTFAGSLPYDLRMQGGTLKAILREIARRNIGPRVASVEKRGFGIPVQRWMTGRWRNGVEDAFRYSILDREGWIHADSVLRMLRSLREGETAPIQLWHLYVLENWIKTRARLSSVRATRATA